MGCRTPKSVFHNRIIYDTIIQSDKETRLDNAIIIKTPPAVLTQAYPNPCDSAGKLRPINTSFNNGKARFRIWTENDSLKYTLEIDSLQDALRTTKDSLLSTKKQVHSDVDTTKTTITKTKLHWKLGLALLIAGFLLGVYVGFKIPKLG